MTEVEKPFAFTVPLSVAVVFPIPVAALVVAEGEMQRVVNEYS